MATGAEYGLTRGAGTKAIRTGHWPSRKASASGGTTPPVTRAIASTGSALTLCSTCGASSRGSGR